ncbi:hypothetical protein [Ancylobacter sp.]|uniref:hypothetical protein n=1 Tax=Ancylobacter sp. TaxID=1872567 RepID=UPI003BAAC57C
MTAKRIVVHFEDETGSLIVSQIQKHKPDIGGTARLCGRTYVIDRERPSRTSHDYYARPESEKREMA